MDRTVTTERQTGEQNEVN